SSLVISSTIRAYGAFVSFVSRRLPSASTNWTISGLSSEKCPVIEEGGFGPISGEGSKAPAIRPRVPAWPATSLSLTCCSLRPGPGDRPVTGTTDHDRSNLASHWLDAQNPVARVRA